MPWALPPLLAALLALLPSACGQTFGSSNVITVPTVAYISCEFVPWLLTCCICYNQRPHWLTVGAGKMLPCSVSRP